MKICPVCNTEFQEINNQQVYCSHVCKNTALLKRKNEKKSQKRLEQWNQQDHMRICPVCNQEFILRQKHVTQIYCSKQCRQKAERIFGSKQQTDLDYKDQIRFGGNKYNVLKRDEYECQICGNQKQLVIHHIDGSGQSDDVNNDIDNLVTLCRKCHINIHRLGLIPTI
jgi:5-methylcytosine-specific restriction endonuclease McrA